MTGRDHLQTHQRLGKKVFRSMYRIDLIFYPAFIELMLVTMLVVFPFSSHAKGESHTKETPSQKDSSLSQLLSDGWTISHYSVSQSWIDVAENPPNPRPPMPKPTRYTHNFILQKDKKVCICWGTTLEGLKNAFCQPLN